MATLYARGASRSCEVGDKTIWIGEQNVSPGEIGRQLALTVWLSRNAGSVTRCGT
jgi:hypothetical protein